MTEHENKPTPPVPGGSGTTIGPTIRLRIWILIALLTLLLMVPFAAVGLALKKTGWLGGVSIPGPGKEIGSTSASATNGKATDPDLSGLRKSLETAAESILPTPILPDPSTSAGKVQMPGQETNTP